MLIDNSGMMLWKVERQPYSKMDGKHQHTVRVDDNKPVQ